MDNRKPTRSECYISPEDQAIYDQTRKELFDEVRPGVFVKKDIPPAEDPNEACYDTVATWVYGFAEYRAKIDAVTDINYTRKTFHTSMLQESISTNLKTDIAEDLIRRGIDVNIQDNRGNTALHYLAGKMKETKVLPLFELILENGADLHLLNKKGQSVLWLAVHCVGPYPSEEQRNLVRKMVDMGADKNILPESFQEDLEIILHGDVTT